LYKVNLLSRLLLLVAVLLMPFGMAPAATSAAHHQMTAEMTMGHCPDQSSNHSTKAGLVECTMACAAALPAADTPAEGPMVVYCDPVMPGAARSLDGLHPETATPPPKRS
jgi:hypothetical protein